MEPLWPPLVVWCLRHWYAPCFFSIPETAGKEQSCLHLLTFFNISLWQIRNKFQASKHTQTTTEWSYIQRGLIYIVVLNSNSSTPTHLQLLYTCFKSLAHMVERTTTNIISFTLSLHRFGVKDLDPCWCSMTMSSACRCIRRQNLKAFDYHVWHVRQARHVIISWMCFIWKLHQMSSKAPEMDIEFEFVQPLHVEDLEIPLQEPFTEAEEPCSKRCKPVSNFIVTLIYTCTWMCVGTQLSPPLSN